MDVKNVFLITDGGVASALEESGSFSETLFKPVKLSAIHLKDVTAHKDTIQKWFDSDNNQQETKSEISPC